MQKDRRSQHDDEQFKSASTKKVHTDIHTHTYIYGHTYAVKHAQVSWDVHKSSIHTHTRRAQIHTQDDKEDERRQSQLVSELARSSANREAASAAAENALRITRLLENDVSSAAIVADAAKKVTEAKLAELENKFHIQAAEVTALKLKRRRQATVTEPVTPENGNYSTSYKKDRKVKHRQTTKHQIRTDLDSDVDYSSGGSSSSSSPQTTKKKKHRAQRGGYRNYKATFAKLMYTVTAQRTQASAERRLALAHEETERAARRFEAAQEVADRRVAAERDIDRALWRLHAHK
jgi:hypothetical protein